MLIKTTIPLRMTLEAVERAAALGMLRELKQMLEHTLQVVPALRAIDVSAAIQYDTGEDPRVLIEATRAQPHLEYDPTDWDWGHWLVKTFPPDVCQHFCMLSVYE